MTTIQKTNMVYNWLMAGYAVRQVGKLHTSIVKDGKFFRWSNYGSSAVDADKKSLQWLIQEIFDDGDFYIIDTDGKLISTADGLTLTAEREYTFTLWARNIWTRQEKPLRQYKMRLVDMIREYYDVAEGYAAEHPTENHVHFAMTCGESDYFTYWNFCI